MERYEYKLVATPTKSVKYTGLSKSGDAFAQTLGDGMNELGRDGWQFLRTETVVEKRNVLVFSSKRCRHEYMVYRRPLRSSGMSMDDPVKTRRVKPANVPDPTVLKSRIEALISDEAAQSPRVLTPFEIIGSKLN